jgi:hypothetical protein
MKRKTIETRIGVSLYIDTDYACGGNPFCIDEIIEFLQKSKKTGATHITISGSSYYDGSVDDIEIQPVKIEMESDESYTKRIAEEESRQKAAENALISKEKALYEELKLKYGS